MSTEPRDSTRQHDPASWKAPSNVIAVASSVLSVFALGISIRGCRIAEENLKISHSDFESSRSLVFKGSLSNDNDELTFSPIDSNIQMQYGAIYLPPKLDDTIWNISPPNYTFPLVSLRFNIQEYLNKAVRREKDFVKVLDQTGIPIIVNSTYVARGEAYAEQSLYSLMYIGVVSDDPDEMPSIAFKGIVFMRRLPIDTDPHAYLKSLWRSGPTAK